MNRIRTLFKTLGAQKRCGLIAYVTCGDPSLGATVEIVRALEAAGADAIELGVPFSDPVADGPVIQAAAQRALLKGTTMLDVLEVARRIRAFSEIPLIAFSYLNPIVRFGAERFATEAQQAGVDGVLITDLPPESSAELSATMHAHQLGTIFLAAPTSSERRLRAIAKASDHFVYYVSTTGVTGTRTELDPALVDRLDEVRRTIRKPVAVGFGISRHEHYEALREHCEAVVVGSAIVRAIAEGDEEGAPARAAAVVTAVLG